MVADHKPERRPPPDRRLVSLAGERLGVDPRPTLPETPANLPLSVGEGWGEGNPK